MGLTFKFWIKVLFAICVVVLAFLPTTRNFIKNTVLETSGSLRFGLLKENLDSDPQLNIETLQAQIQVLTQENKRLEQELGFVDQKIVRQPLRTLAGKSKIYKNTFLDIGEVPVSEGDFVYAKGEVLAGALTNVQGHIAELQFLGNKNNFIAEIESTGELVELSGNGIGYYRGNVPNSTSIAAGDVVVMKGYPKSIVGIVSSVESTESSVSVVWVRSPINLLKAEIFYVDAK